MPTTEQQWFDFAPAAPAAAEPAPAPLLVAPRPAPAGDSLALDEAGEVAVRRSAKATRYRLSVGRDGTAVLTIPISGFARSPSSYPHPL